MSRSPRIRDHELGVTSIQTQSPGFLRSDRHLSFTHCWYDISRMGGDIDPQNQAEAAMKEAVNADGFQRQRWIQVAQAWLELARPAEGRYRYGREKGTNVYNGSGLDLAPKSRFEFTGQIARCFAMKTNFMSLPSRRKLRPFLGYPARPSA